MGADDGNRNKDDPWPSSNKPYQEKEEDVKLWGILLFGLIGATATTFATEATLLHENFVFSQFLLLLFSQILLLTLLAIWQVGQLRRTVDWFYVQMTRSQSSWKGATGRSFRSSFQEEAWKRYNRRMQEEYEEEMERVERIRRMQSVFNRERSKYKRGYESWKENGPGAFHQHFQRDDWYWKTDTSYRDRKTNYRETPRASAAYSLSHHYSVLGLDRRRTTPYTDAEIKTAFRAKAKAFHPDQNQNNKEAAEAKFKEVMTSYEAIKQERKNMNI